MNKNYELFVGRLGKEPDLRYTPKQNPVCYLSVAVNQEGEENPDWKKVVVWGKQAELCNMYLKEGSEVFVQGQNQEKSFKTKEGPMKTYWEVSARSVGFTAL